MTTDVALLHFDGADAGPILDGYGATWSNTGGLTTAQQKFGTGSYDGTAGLTESTDFVEPDFNFDVGDLTIDCWLYLTSLPIDEGGGEIFSINAPMAGIDTLSFRFFEDGAGGYLLSFKWSTDGVGQNEITQAWTPSTGAWFHLEFTRESGEGRFYVDGIRQGSSQAVAGDIFFESGSAIRTNGTGPDGIGYMDELRVAQGAAHGDEDFTPPSAAYTVAVHGSAAITLPSLTLVGTGGPNPVGTSAFTLPSLIAVITGTLNFPADAAWYLPQLALTGTGLAGIAAASDITLPLLTVAITADNGNPVLLPLLTMASAGVEGALGAGAFNLPLSTLLSAGLMNVVASAALPLPVLTLFAAGNAGVTGRAAGTLPMLTLFANGVMGATGTAAFDLPLLTLDAAGHVSIVGTAAFALPLLQLSAQGQLTVASTFRTWVLNMHNKALTEYTNFPFNSYAIFNGVVLAAASDGLYVLDLTNADVATAISASAVSGKFDLGSSFNNRVPRLYVTADMTATLNVSAVTTEHGTHVYALPLQGRLGLQTRLVKLGKGIRSRMYQFGVDNTAGGDMNIHSIVIDPAMVKRRIQ